MKCGLVRAMAHLATLNSEGIPLCIRVKNADCFLCGKMRCSYNFANSDDKKKILFIKTDSRLTRIRTKDIIYIEALKDYVNIYTVDNKYCYPLNYERDRR